MHKANKLFLLTILTLVILSTIGCKNYYNDMIDWDNPDTLETRIRYEIVEIKGNRDILKMQNFVVFEDGKFAGREYQK